MKFFLSIIVFLSTLLTALSQHSAKGKLFIIGGGTRSDALIKDMVTTAGLRQSDYIIVLPMASEIPDTGFKYISKQISSFTDAPVKSFNFTKYGIAQAGWIDSVKNARLIYILGGDQSRFMRTVLNTPLYDAIHLAYRQGSTIAGTSAGAAVMSQYMITGKQLTDTNYAETFNQVVDNNIEFAQGLGLLQNTIIDQHFIKRSRYNRLISALEAHPGFTCIGIDESTAIVVSGSKARVTGDSQVVKLYKPQKLQIAGKLIKFKNARLGIFTHGDVIKIKK